MTLKNKIQNLFELTQAKELFLHSITPKSCGGTDYFKYLALIGDKVLDLALITIISESKPCDTGFLRMEIIRIHNERTLSQLGSCLELDKLMTPVDSNHKPTLEELKESVEALIGASYSINGIDTVITIIEKLMDLIIPTNRKSDINDISTPYFDINYIGTLQEHLQQLGEEIPEYEFSNNLGLDHEPLFYCVVKVKHEGKTLQCKSDMFRRKKDAQRQTAQKMLILLGFMDDLSNQRLKSNLTTKNNKIIRSATKSFDEKIIIFKSQGKKDAYSNLPLTINPSESIMEYAARKREKNPYSFLLLLSARLDIISGASWSAEISQIYLVLLNFKIGDSMHFEIGFGSSKSKARKMAAHKIIEQSKLMSVLESQFNNY